MTDASMKQYIQSKLNEEQWLWLNQILKKQTWDQTSEFKDFCSQFTEDSCDCVQVPSFVRKSFVVGQFDPFLHEGHDITQCIMTHLYVIYVYILVHMKSMVQRLLTSIINS